MVRVLSLEKFARRRRLESHTDPLQIKSVTTQSEKKPFVVMLACLTTQELIESCLDIS